MSSTTLSSKGQIVIPAHVRQPHGLMPGMTFEVEAVEGCIILRPTSEVRRTTLEELVGCTGYSGPPRTLEDMERGIAAGVRARLPQS